jgi:hypothetical protein
MVERALEDEEYAAQEVAEAVAAEAKVSANS